MSNNGPVRCPGLITGKEKAQLMGDQAFLVTHLDQSKILLKNENNNFQTKNVIVIT